MHWKKAFFVLSTSSLESALPFSCHVVGFDEAIVFLIRNLVLSEKNFQKISMTFFFFFFYKNKIALTSPTLWLKKDFALFRE